MIKFSRLNISLLAFTLSLVSLGAVYLFRAGPAQKESPSETRRAGIDQSFGNLPLPFIENRGQADARVSYYIQSPGKSIYFTRSGHIMRLDGGRGDSRSHVIGVELMGATTDRIESLRPIPGTISYFKGNRANWKTDIPTHGMIGYAAPWPGIDLAYDGGNGEIESIYTVAPYADPNQIKLRYSGQSSLDLDPDGNLVYATSLGEIRETAPVAWQDVNGHRRAVKTSFVLVDDDTVSFNVGDYDRSEPLTIDPSLIYATYIGGSASDRGVRITVDSSGSAYLVGDTFSTEATFPDTVGPGTTQGGGSDLYVAKLNPAGTALVYAGFIGGTGNEDGAGIAVDSSGNAYVVGSTNSTQATFPVSGGPSTVYGGGDSDGFIAKINSTGSSLVYCGFIGGTSRDSATGVGVNASGNAFIAGSTNSPTASFPVTVGPDLVQNGAIDVYVAKLNTSGTAYEYAGYIGGANDEDDASLAVDAAGNAFVSGRTTSTQSSFPVTVGPDLTHNNPAGDQRDAFVAKVNTGGTALVYCGYVGGGGLDEALSLAIDSSGAAYITGRTSSTESSFPVAVGPDLTHNSPGGFDPYVAKIKPDGTGIEYVGFIGGITGDEYGFGIAVDSRGCAYVTGRATSDETTFPALVGPDVTFNGGGIDGFVAKVSPSGHTLIYSGFIGGNNSDIGVGVAVDSSDNAYVSGNASSTESTFPDGDGFGSIPGFDQVQNGSFDAFVVKISAMPPPTPFDFDGDGLADISVFRPSDTYWYRLNSTGSGYTAFPWGLSTDVLVPADYDGDGKTDHAVYRSGTWYIYQSSNSATRIDYLGNSTDLPRPGDFDGDKKADIAIWRPSTGDWWITTSSNSTLTATHFGTSGDHPMLGDFDRDAKTDIAVFRPSTGYWWILRSSDAVTSGDLFGQSGDIPVNGDFHGDGQSCLAVFRPSDHTWYVARHKGVPSSNFDSFSFGLSTDIPVPADYDGDGKTDHAVFRNGDWWIQKSQNGLFYTSWGLSTDKPVEASYLP